MCGLVVSLEGAEADQGDAATGVEHSCGLTGDELQTQNFVV